jgi:hypothetical protein
MKRTRLDGSNLMREFPQGQRINIDDDSMEPLFSAVRHFIHGIVLEQEAGVAQCLSHCNAESASG